MSRYSPTERTGVNRVEALTLGLGWVFREQPIVDMGIDAHIESTIDNDPTGKMIGIQIKTGSSHFTIKDEELIYYGSIVHLEYWLKHSLPVVLIAHLPDTNETYWVHILENSIDRTKKAWKVTIPRTSVFGEGALRELEQIVEGTSQEIKLRNLFFNKGLMSKLENGERLFVETEEWLNKSLSRGSITIKMRNLQGEEEIVSQSFSFYTGFSLDEYVGYKIPWANLVLDNEFYEENFCESVFGVYDKEYIALTDFYPYEVVCNEVGNYRFELQLNELGSSFLVVADHLEIPMVGRKN